MAAPRNRKPRSSSYSARAIASAEKTAQREHDELEADVAELLAALGNGKLPVTDRMNALQDLAALDFLGPRFDPFRVDYRQALRDVATGRSAKLRDRALELLALVKDPWAQDLLVKGLKQPEAAPVSEARAIQFLGYDDHHAEVVPLARQMVKQSTGYAREEALRVLGSDPNSEPLFTRLLKDKSEKSSVRQLSASGLQSLNPEAFEKEARKIITDDSDYNEIRATSLTALTHGRPRGSPPPDPKFVDKVQNITTRSPRVRASIQNYVRATEA
jgi:hypothetical protein